MNGWVVNNLSKVMVAALIVLLLAGALVARSCSQARTAKTGQAVSKGQAGAAAASGADAVSVVGNRADADAAEDATTRANDAEIRNAEGADTAVAAPVRNAGLASLCRRASYRLDPKCVQYARP